MDRSRIERFAAGAGVPGQAIAGLVSLPHRKGVAVAIEFLIHRKTS